MSESAEAPSIQETSRFQAQTALLLRQVARARERLEAAPKRSIRPTKRSTRYVDPNSSQWALAHRAAGEAVGLRYLRLPVKSVALLRGTGRYGAVQSERDVIPESGVQPQGDARRHSRDRLLAQYVGYLAEAAARPASRRTGLLRQASSAIGARMFMLGLEPIEGREDETVREAAVETLRTEAESLINQSEVSTAIKVLSLLLLEQPMMREEEVDAIVLPMLERRVA